MPGFLAWIADLFSSQPREPATAEARLFNPAPDAPDSGHPEYLPELALQLEERLFGWLLATRPETFDRDLSRYAGVREEFHNRLAAKQLAELPRQPLTLPLLMRALANENSNHKDLTDIILGDPALTKQVLRVANSPLFRPRNHTIESIDQAVFFLGVNGIRNVISASVMRPLMVARNSKETHFAQKVWRWGMVCARAAEVIARDSDEDPSAHFTVALLPALAYMTIKRELTDICQAHLQQAPDPALIRTEVARHQWKVCQLVANEWQLPPNYHAYLLSAERPAPEPEHTPLTDGMIMGTQELLKHAGQPTLTEEELATVVLLTPEKIRQVRQVVGEVLVQPAPSKARS